MDERTDSRHRHFLHYLGVQYLHYAGPFNIPRWRNMKLLFFDFMLNVQTDFNLVFAPLNSVTVF